MNLCSYLSCNSFLPLLILRGINCCIVLKESGCAIEEYLYCLKWGKRYGRTEKERMRTNVQEEGVALVKQMHTDPVREEGGVNPLSSLSQYCFPFLRQGIFRIKVMGTVQTPGTNVF